MGYPYKITACQLEKVCVMREYGLYGAWIIRESVYTIRRDERQLYQVSVEDATGAVIPSAD